MSFNNSDRTKLTRKEILWRFQKLRKPIWLLKLSRPARYEQTGLFLPLTTVRLSLICKICAVQPAESGVTIKVVKNRLIRVAMSENVTYKNTDTSLLQGQLLYAVSAEDEVSPAKVLDGFAKTHPALVFVGAFGMEGEVIDAAGVKALAGLPTKNELIGQVISTLLSPVSDVTNALSGNPHAFRWMVSKQKQQLNFKQPQLLI